MGVMISLVSAYGRLQIYDNKPVQIIPYLKSTFWHIPRVLLFSIAVILEFTAFAIASLPLSLESGSILATIWGVLWGLVLIFVMSMGSFYVWFLIDRNFNLIQSIQHSLQLFFKRQVISVVILQAIISNLLSFITVPFLSSLVSAIWYLITFMVYPYLYRVYGSNGR